jgi:hypothetical protein
LCILLIVTQLLLVHSQNLLHFSSSGPEIQIDTNVNHENFHRVDEKKMVLMVGQKLPQE